MEKLCRLAIIYLEYQHSAEALGNGILNEGATNNEELLLISGNNGNVLTLSALIGTAFLAWALSLLGRIPEAMERLRAMGATDTEDGYDRLAKARSDRDFVPARPHPEFKQVTGYAKVIILNSRGEYGEEEVERIQEYVEAAGYPVADVLAGKHDNRPYPEIWHKEGAAKSTRAPSAASRRRRVGRTRR